MKVHNSTPGGKFLPVSTVVSRLKDYGFPASKSYIYTLIDTGEIKSIRVGSRQGIRVREDWLNHYIEAKCAGENE
jgi:excisionase family DNA binding protein